jgi:excisionase family DNA binding protein
VSHSPTKVRGGNVLTVDEVAELLGVHNNTVKRIPPADIPFFRVGSRGDRRYIRWDIERYIERRMVNG